MDKSFVPLSPSLFLTTMSSRSELDSAGEFHRVAIITHFLQILDRKDFDSRVCRSCWRKGALLPRETPDRCQGLALRTATLWLLLSPLGKKPAISSSLDDG